MFGFDFVRKKNEPNMSWHKLCVLYMALMHYAYAAYV